MVAERFNAVSSTFGPVSPAAASAFAFRTGFRYSAKERNSKTVAMAQRTIAANNPGVPRVEVDAQDSQPQAESDRAEKPDDRRGIPDYRDTVQAQRRIRGVGRTQRDDDDPRHDQRTDKQRGAEDVESKYPGFEIHLENSQAHDI